MIVTTLKKTVGLAALLAVLTGCSNTSTTGESSAATAGSETSNSVTVGTGDTAGMEASMALESVFYFDFDQSTLKAESRAVLMAHAAKLKDMPMSVRLEGHADERGTREYNMALGERRANSVRNFLVLQGVDGSLIETISYGEESPAVYGSSETSYAQNRRVELK